MNKTIATLFASVIGLGLFASPVRDSLASRMNAEEESDPRNLWVWPTDAFPQNGQPNVNPDVVWTPQTGIWYYGIAVNGYVRKSRYCLVDWWESGVKTSYVSGYSAGAFLALEPGTYSITANVDGYTRFHLGFYREVEGGYQWNSNMALSSQQTAGRYERTFTVPEGISLVLLLPTSGTSSELTTTNIEIYRID